MSARRLELPITGALAGIKVDTLLKRHLGLSGTVVRRIKWLEDGILVDGARVNTRFCPQEGQVLSVRLSDPERRSGILPEPGPLDVVYEDGDVVVLNKAPGVPVHPGPGHYSDTVGNYLLYYYDQEGTEGDFHPIHRLDRGTSGLMAVAKHAHAHELLQRQLQTGQFSRTYLAVCEGVPVPRRGCVDAPIGRQPDSILKREVRPDGAAARTHYEVVRTGPGQSLVRLALETGRTHQIRVHMAYLGCPLAGDFLYGQELPELRQRFALHSASIRLLQPITGEEIALTSPLPAELNALLNQ